MRLCTSWRGRVLTARTTSKHKWVEARRLRLSERKAAPQGGCFLEWSEVVRWACGGLGDWVIGGMWYNEDMLGTEIMTVVVLVLMFMLGAVLGSFACCQAWRWRWRALGKKDLGQWSVCMHCKKRLKWYDNIPIVSWLVLRGRCRNCHEKIGVADFLSEVSMAVAFLMLSWAYLLPVLENWGILSLHPDYLATRLAIFVLILVLLVVLTVLAVYDAKWGELPTVLLILAVVFGGMVALLKVHEAMILGEDVVEMLVEIGVGVLILAGT